MQNSAPTLPQPKRASAVGVSWQREQWVLGGVGFLLGLMILVVMPAWADALRREHSDPLTTLSLALPSVPYDVMRASPSAVPSKAEPADWRTVTVKPGQTLGDIFTAQGLGASELNRFLAHPATAAALRRIHPGDEFAFDVGSEGALHALRYDPDERTRTVLTLTADGLRQDNSARPVERRLQVASADIRQSLFAAGEAAGMSDATILELANVFAYDIDFAQDLRTGDSFSVIYDELYSEGERIRGGGIVAASFTNQGKRYSAVRHIDAEGHDVYYSAEGRPLRRAFLRTPVEFTRISSRFTSGRMHPVLGRMRAHRGVDYAAPTGTPIRAAGNGKVAFRGWKSGYGNAIIVQHGGHYSTLYGHLSRFASSLRQGGKVSQGDVIGYVGRTGLATGPHLHYEFRVDGAHRDPLKVALPQAEPLPPEALARFRSQTAPLVAQLKLLESRTLAALN